MTDIVSPLPGTFYSRPSPDAEAFKNPGDDVANGDIIGLIEVMKTFIEVKSEIAGKFETYIAEDTTPVTPGQILAQVSS